MKSFNAIKIWRPNFKMVICRLGGLHLSQHGLDWGFWSRQSKKWDIDCSESLKSEVSTVLIPLSLNFWLSLHQDSWSGQSKKWHLNCSESLGSFKRSSLDTIDTPKSQFWTQSSSRLSISTVQKACLKVSKNLDLDWSWQSGPPKLRYLTFFTPKGNPLKHFLLFEKRESLLTAN
jgi:hypothetical protein